jgi:iron complex transport system substrate-binding protein
VFCRLTIRYGASNLGIMVYRVTLLAAIFLVFLTGLSAQRRLDAWMQPNRTPTGSCRRIVSMAPSITETLYALGLGDRVVGVTRYCNYPLDAKKKPQTGGYYDPNFEAIVAVRPDLVVMLDDHEQTMPGFEKLGLQTLVVSHRTVDGIIESFRTIGRACGKENEGRRLAADFNSRLERIRRKTPLAPKPRVLFSLDRKFGSGHLTDVYMAGADGYFEKMIELAGGENAYRVRGVRNPVVSPEGILWLNPDVIVDMVPKDIVEQLTRKTILADWDELGQVSAVKNHRVVIFDQDYAYVPGPRFIRVVEDLAEVLETTRK